MYKLGSRTACAAAVAALLTACGGGGDSGTTAEASGGDRARAAAISPQTSSDTLIFVSLPSGSDGNTIVFKNSRGTTLKLTRPDGVAVTSLDDLPLAVVNHTWTRSTTSKGNLRIKFRPGVYRLKRGWVWPAEASGKDAARQVVLEKAESGEVAIHGSQALSATYQATAGKMTLSAGTLQFEQLWAEGARAIRARAPNVGSYFYVRGPAAGWPASDTDPTVVSTLYGGEVAKQAFQADTSSFALLQEIMQKRDSGAVVQMIDSWQATKHQVAEVDAAGQRVRLTPGSFWKFAEHGHGQRYFIENTMSALDARGEWYLQRGTSNTLHYIPTAAVANGATVRFEVPVVNKLLSMQGAVDSGKWVQFVQFSGLKFRYAKVDMPRDGYLDAQADIWVDAAIELNDARNVEFANCEVSRTGGYGIWLNKRVRNVVIDGTEMFDLGAGGVKVGEAAVPIRPNPELNPLDPTRTGANRLVNNRIHSTGHVYPGAVGVWVGRSSDNVVANNLIRNTTYSGISVGWNWDSVTSMARNNQITNNFLHNIGQSALADMGGIYLLGRSSGTTVSGNVIKEVRSYDVYTGGSNGIYADEGSSELSITGNIVLGANGAGYSQHYGQDNVLRGNVFANTATAFGVAKRDGSSSAVPVTLDGNAFLPSSNDMVGRSNDASLIAYSNTAPPAWVPTTPVITNNRVSGQFLPSGTTLQLPSLCTGCFAKSTLTVTDPGPLRVPKVSDMTLTEGTNVARSWDTVAMASVASASRMWSGSAASVPPRQLDFQAAQWPLGWTNMTGWQLVAQPGYAIDPADATVPLSVKRAADGTSVLALADTARSDFTWEPYIQTGLGHKSGTTTVTFTARFDASTNLTHAWRSDDNGTAAGPEVSFVSNGSSINVVANGQVRATVPFGTWVTVEVISPIAAGATWSLRLTTSQGTETVTGLRHVHANWSYLGPMLFVSNSNARTTTEFRSIQAVNRP